MTDLTLHYRHNTSPHRGLAATGIVFVKFLLIIPHALVVGAIQYLAMLLAYIGFWIVAITGEMPQAAHRLLEIAFGWTARMWGWNSGLVDVYPPFETDPDYPIAFFTPKPKNPSRSWAVTGILLVKFLIALPHLIVMAFLGLGAGIAMWVGYWIVVFTGELPTGIQDFVAGVLQWNLRVAAWIAGLTDEYPPFSLEARASE